VLGLDCSRSDARFDSENYVNATRGYGARVELTPTIAAAFAEVDR
jgi:hypothetical protein